MNEVKPRTRRIMHFTCDMCGLEFTTSYNARNFNRRNFCRTNRNCLRSARCVGSIINTITRATKLERHGSETFNNREKFEQTCLNRYGVTNVFNVPEIRTAYLQKNLENYGDENPTKTDIVKQRIVDTQIERYGVSNAMLLPEFKKKYRDTCFKNHGVEFPMQSPVFRAKARATWKLNGYRHSSAVEDSLYDKLCEIFGVNNVQRQVYTLGFMVDFYITSCDLYVEFDGIYWHGLNKNFTQLFVNRHANAQALTCLKTYLRDRRRDALFAKENLKLVHIIEFQEEIGLQSLRQLKEEMENGKSKED